MKSILVWILIMLGQQRFGETLSAFQTFEASIIFYHGGGITVLSKPFVRLSLVNVPVEAVEKVEEDTKTLKRETLSYH
jgi:uncharacterized membrane protein